MSACLSFTFRPVPHVLVHLALLALLGWLFVEVKPDQLLQGPVHLLLFAGKGARASRVLVLPAADDCFLAGGRGNRTAGAGQPGANPAPYSVRGGCGFGSAGFQSATGKIRSPLFRVTRTRSDHVARAGLDSKNHGAVGHDRTERVKAEARGQRELPPRNKSTAEAVL